MMMFPLMSRMRVGVRTVSALVVLLIAVAAPARAGVMPPDYGFQWCTVGDPGNRLPNAAETPAWAGLYPYGSVGHTYRLTKTEVTNG